MQIQNSSVKSRIFPARLMSPDEVKAATSQAKEIPHAVKSGWALCGDVSEEFWMMMESGIEPVVYRVSAFTSSNNCGYVIFTIQVRDYQTRFLLQMGGVKHSRFISNGGRDGIFISLGRNGGDRAMLQKFRIQQHELEPLSSLSKRCVPKGFLSGLAEWQSVTQSALALETIPSAMPDIKVSNVILNIVTPPFEESVIS